MESADQAYQHVAEMLKPALTRTVRPTSKT